MIIFAWFGLVAIDESDVIVALGWLALIASLALVATVVAGVLTVRAVRRRR